VATIGFVSNFEILAVCLGNICRSPMAEAVIGGRLAAAGLGDKVTVGSAGTGSWHIGHPADARARETLERAGYVVNHSARQVDSDWIGRTNLVLAMDRWNLQDLRAMAPRSYDLTRIRLLRSFDPRLRHLPEDDELLDIPDPYYGELSDFRQAVEYIEDAAPGVIDEVRLELGS